MCVATRRLLTSVCSLPTGAVRQQAVLKTIILFVAKYGMTHKENGAMSLASWNADVVHGRKLELENFIIHDPVHK
jgi:hypothetical protein